MKNKGNMWRGKGIWLKGNTHTHTIYSDGVWTPEEVRREYGRRGYDFVFLTDHWKRTVPSASGQKPLVIPAEEIDFSLRDDFYHVVCLGLRHEWQRRSFRSLDELIRLAKKRNIYLIMAHPYWCGSRSETYIRAGNFPAVEVYNTVCDGLNAKGYSGSYWDDFLDAGKRVFGIAADDAHQLRTAGGGWIMLKATGRTEPAILSAMRKGHFYATQGPEIRDIQITGRHISIACSPVVRINFISNRSTGSVVRAQDKRLTEAEWDVPPSVKYVRIECVDKNNKTAWSNPVWTHLDQRAMQRMQRHVRQSAVVLKMSGKPPNGILAKVDWSDAHALTRWRSLTGAPTPRKLEARLINDDRYLYIRLEERIDPRRLVMFRRHNPIWTEDDWELFFAKQPATPYRQMGINARGVHLDLAYGETPGIWKSNAIVASNTRLPGRWEVQIALPLARLVRGGARPGQKIYLNIIRSTPGQAALGWIPTFGGYHEPSRLGAVLLK